MCKGLALGFVLAGLLSALALTRYGAWREKIGGLQGRKEGSIEVIEFLARHFPAPSGEPVLPGHEYGLKWYSIVVVETNGVTTLRAKSEM